MYIFAQSIIKGVFCEVMVTLTSDLLFTKFWPVHLWVSVNICTKSEEAASKCSWDTNGTRTWRSRAAVIVQLLTLNVTLNWLLSLPSSPSPLLLTPPHSSSSSSPLSLFVCQRAAFWTFLFGWYEPSNSGHALKMLQKKPKKPNKNTRQGCDEDQFVRLGEHLRMLTASSNFFSRWLPHSWQVYMQLFSGSKQSWVTPTEG